MHELIRSASRRDILKSGALLAAAPVLLKGAPAAQAIKVGLVGCGGRGTGAASQALKADDLFRTHRGRRYLSGAHRFLSVDAQARQGEGQS